MSSFFKKLVLVLMIFSFGVSLSASEMSTDLDAPIVVGDYSFKGQYQVTFEKTIVTLMTSIPSNEVRKLELEAKGFSCVERSSFYLCVRHLKNPKLPDHLRKDINAQINNQNLKLYDFLGQSKLIYRSEFLKQWRVEQKAVSNNQVFSEIFYDWNQGLASVLIPLSSEMRRFKIQKDSNGTNLVESKIFRYVNSEIDQQFFVDLQLSAK